MLFSISLNGYLEVYISNENTYILHYTVVLLNARITRCGFFTRFDRYLFYFLYLGDIGSDTYPDIVKTFKICIINIFMIKKT